MKTKDEAVSRNPNSSFCKILFYSIWKCSSESKPIATLKFIVQKNTLVLYCFYNNTNQISFLAVYLKKTEAVKKQMLYFVTDIDNTFELTLRDVLPSWTGKECTEYFARGFALHTGKCKFIHEEDTLKLEIPLASSNIVDNYVTLLLKSNCWKASALLEILHFGKSNNNSKSMAVPLFFANLKTIENEEIEFNISPFTKLRRLSGSSVMEKIPNALRDSKVVHNEKTSEKEEDSSKNIDTITLIKRVKSKPKKRKLL